MEGLFYFLLLVIVIIVLSAVISGSEAAILSISYIRVKNNAKNFKGKKKKLATDLLMIKENLQNYISTIVVLNNVVNIVGSIYIGIIATNLFGEVYLGLVSGILTFLIILFSEIIPKIYGENNAEKISLLITPILIFCNKIFRPIIFILNKISSLFVRSNNSKNHISKSEMKEITLMSKKDGSINNYESEIITNVLKMNETEVYNIMIPKNEVFMIEKNTSYDKILEHIKDTGFTRFPIIYKNEILGNINVKDLFKYNNKVDKFSISKIIRPIFYVPETMKIFELQEKFKKEKTHMCAVVDEFGEFVGIVTLEDTIEELVGEIEDEFDKNEINLIKEIDKKTYHIQANISIENLLKDLNIKDSKINLNEDYTTLNGFLLNEMGRIPKVNSKLKINNLRFRVIKASKKKVIEVELIIL